MTESKFDSVNSIEPVKILGKFNKIFFIRKQNERFFFLDLLEEKKDKTYKENGKFVHVTDLLTRK